MSFEIRLMNNKDVKKVAKLYYEAFGQKAKLFIPSQKETVISIIEEGMLSLEENYKNYYIATENNEILGFIKLMKHNSKDKFKMPQRKYIFDVGITKFFTTIFAFSFFHSKINTDEAYIESLVVSPDKRGLGIGSILIDYAKKVAKKSKEIKKLTLHVIDKNIGAKKLYERKGFKTISTTEHPKLKNIININRIDFMIKEVD